MPGYHLICLCACVCTYTMLLCRSQLSTICSLLPPCESGGFNLWLPGLATSAFTWWAITLAHATSFLQNVNSCSNISTRRDNLKNTREVPTLNEVRIIAYYNYYLDQPWGKHTLDYVLNNWDLILKWCLILDSWWLLWLQAIYHNYYSIAVRRHCDQGNLKKNAFNWKFAYSFSVSTIMVGWWESWQWYSSWHSWQLTSWSTGRRWREAGMDFCHLRA